MIEKQIYSKPQSISKRVKLGLFRQPQDINADFACMNKSDIGATFGTRTYINPEKIRI